MSQNDLFSLLKKKLSVEELKDIVTFAKSEIDEVEGDLLKVDVKDTNRPDLWSAEGIARELKGKLKLEIGIPKYEIEKSNVIVKVDEKVSKVRPLTVCAVVRNLKLNKDSLSQIIQLQEKIATSFGRNRKEVAIGVYDLNKIKPPIRYTAVKPTEIKFVPLDFKEEMTPKEILEKHPKGKEFGYLLKDAKEYPVFIDSANEVLSMPPIINSEYSGKVTEETRNVFIECSGFNFKFLIPALNSVVAALGDRNGRMESVEVFYKNRKIITPDFAPKKASVSVKSINKLSGLNLLEKEIENLLMQARYEVINNGKIFEVLYPAYRQDIMHENDVVEDVIVSYGYNRIQPEILKIKTEGKASEIEIFSKEAAKIMVDLGFQEIISYSLTNKENLFKKMRIAEERIVEIENPVSLNWNVFRNCLTPSSLEFFSNNQHVQFPQRIFEIGDVVVLNEKKETKTEDVRKLAVGISDSVVGVGEILYVLNQFLSKIKLKYKIRSAKHRSFIEGRVAEVFVNNKSVGVMGEINPEVLENWNLSMPVAAFEINLSEIFNPVSS